MKIKRNKALQGKVAISDKTNYQIELEADLPLTKLSRIIHGAAQPSEAEMEAIARALDVPVHSVFNSHDTVSV